MYEDGTNSGIVDWDGVAAVPKSVGALCYPLALIYDWQSTWYNLDIETAILIDPDGRRENVPGDLERYHVIYTQLVETALPAPPRFKAMRKNIADVTRRS